ncbi:universal stress protein [Pelagibius sp. Alg239-R121]|uniref:universal stress protein n=1 Tax=Pelagibius sp. Alg239-R121 TaxID=2993448 RepID=UPI0024A714F4|nr:universal stress protein [Pelagibius sp. Alg239-R121]
MSNVFIVGFDGTKDGKRALDFALERAKSDNAEVHIVYVLEWSPYSFLTPEELEKRHARRKEEVELASSQIMAPLLKELEGSGLSTHGVIRYGKIPDVICDVAKEVGATQIIVGRHGGSDMAARFFGSVPGTLVQIAPVPITVVP